jgi:putative transposase
MASTYTQIYIQAIFAVRYKSTLLQPQWDRQLRENITTNLQGFRHKMIAINNLPDHLHLFFSMHPNQSLSNLMQHLKADSSKWLNQQKIMECKFQWQDGYAAFSHTHSQVDAIIEYINNQQEYHKKVGFLQEYEKMLRNFNVAYDPRNMFVLPFN